MCQDATLIGSQLSRHQVKLAFVNSLPLTAETATTRKPLLQAGAEFHEALLRLARAFVLEKKDEGRQRLSRAAPVASQGSDADAVDAAEEKLRARIAELRGRANTSGAEEEEGGDGSGSSSAQEAAADPERDLEAELLEKLPVVCGKLLALSAEWRGTPRGTPRATATLDA